jgi:sugar lactone lactonase YvrE
MALGIVTIGTLEAQGTRVRTVVDSMVGRVGGVTVDGLGAIYVADFGETVWKIEPDGRVRVFATGFYGASGNTIDARGNLFQANFSGNYISKVDRQGHQEIYADTGLAGPVGITSDPDGSFYVLNCRSNTISKILPDRSVTTFAENTLLNCPNGITRAPDGHLYVVNFSDGRMLKVTPSGEVTEFATLPGGGNGHVAIARGALYATSFQSHRVYRVSFDGEVTLLAGTGVTGEQNGPADQATFSWPNGIAASPQGDRLFINDFLNRFPPSIEVPPVPRWSLRQVMLGSVSALMAGALQSGGIEAMVEAHGKWKSDPATAAINTEQEVNALGYRLMGGGNLAAATAVFELNVEAYPNAWNVYDSLGEAYMNAGQNDEAIESYEKSLELNPANTNAVDMIAKMRGG